MVNFCIQLPMLALLAVVFGPSDCIGQEEEWMMHNKKVENFKCKVPQPRSFKWTELKLDFEIDDQEKVSPWYTVLNRCESSGCCSKGRICSVIESEMINITFSYIEDDCRKYFTVRAENHKKCSCEKISDKPKK